MNQPNAGQHGLQHPQPLQHPRSAGLIHQQHRPNSPHQSQNLQQPTSQAYASPHSSTHSIPQHHSPYIGSVSGFPPQQPGETTYFGAHPSPYSTNSAAGSYASSEPNEAMATHAAMGRQYPPISSYQTPQSNSPASIHSPPTDAHGRPIYGMPPMAQQMYYPPYQMQQPPQYAHHPSASHHPSITSQPGMLMSHHPQPQAPMQQPPMPPQQQQQQQHQPSHQSHQPSHPPPSSVDSKPPQPPLQRPPSVMSTPQTPSGPGMPGMPPSSAGTNPNAAPGPIPATTPLVVRQDSTGTQWIAFEYSRDRVKMEYTIRCDVESVNVEELSPEFKTNNCVYPRACVGKDQYKGNRLHYESECNAVGWALAQLNPNLREKRGLIQRAVDSWRNSNQDPRLRSRRVRRMAKIHTRKSNLNTPTAPSASVSTPNLQAPAGLTPNSGRRPNLGPGPQMHHHHSDGSDGDHMSGGNEYHAPPSHHPSMSHQQTDLSQQQPRYAQDFYPSYPQQQHVGAPSIPSVHDAMDPMHSRASVLATPATSSKADKEEKRRALFGDIPEAKQRKFILVDDAQRGNRVRVRVTLESENMDEMPDSHLRDNSVYQRSYFPMQMQSAAGWDDFDEEEGVSGVAPTRGKTMITANLMDGSEAQLPVPRMTKAKRFKEIALNELGYRMSWGQSRAFHGRTTFLQRSLDAYRNKQRSVMVAAGQGPSQIPAHFETRAGKRKWQERNKRSKRAETP